MAIGHGAEIRVHDAAYMSTHCQPSSRLGRGGKARLGAAERLGSGTLMSRVSTTALDARCPSLLSPLDSIIILQGCGWGALGSAVLVFSPLPELAVLSASPTRCCVSSSERRTCPPLTPGRPAHSRRREKRPAMRIPVLEIVLWSFVHGGCWCNWMARL